MTLTADARALIGALVGLRHEVEAGLRSFQELPEVGLLLAPGGTTMQPYVNNELARFDAAVDSLKHALALPVPKDTEPPLSTGRFSTVAGHRPGPSPKDTPKSLK